MELHPSDFKVVELLARLKKAEAGYPAELLASRRQDYLRRLAEFRLGAGVFAGVGGTAKVGKSGAPATIGGIVETALVFVIVVQAAVTAYIYRVQIADFIQSFSSNTNATDVAPPAMITPPLPEVTNTELPQAISTLTLTPAAVTETIPTVASETTNTNSQASTTPDPKGNNGNHYGQTPKAERTKDKDKDKDKDK